MELLISNSLVNKGEKQERKAKQRQTIPQQHEGKRLTFKQKAGNKSNVVISQSSLNVNRETTQNHNKSEKKNVIYIFTRLVISCNQHLSYWDWFDLTSVAFFPSWLQHSTILIFFVFSPHMSEFQKLKKPFCKTAK